MIPAASTISKAEQYRQVAALHASNLDQGFISTLGVPFLALLYRAIDEAADSVLLTTEIDGRVVGFVAGARGLGAIYRRMLRRPLRLAVALFPSLFNMQRLRRIMEVLRYGGAAELQAAGGLPMPPHELLSIAVDPPYRGRGIADDLYRRLVDCLAAAGVPAFRIVVGARLGPAHKFYERMGATPVGSLEVHAGEASLLYVHTFASSR